MRVTLCVDALELHGGGIGRYTWELCKGLAERADVSPIFFAHKQMIDDPASLLSIKRQRRPNRLVRAFRWQYAKAILRSTLVHGPNYFLPLHAETGVITVHDLSVFRYPELHPAKRIEDFERHLRRSIDQAEVVITDCETIRREVISFAGLAPERVTAVPLGVSERFRPMPFEERAGVLRRYDLPLTGYGLTVSTLEPRKRIDRLISAWRQLPRATRERYPLVIAGAKGWKDAGLQVEIERAAAEGWLLSLGFVAEEDLPVIYSGATLFVFPSVYEGFGFPPLEAMASGVPTIVAAGSCLVEVTKGAAMTADPDDIPAFMETICRGLEDSGWRRDAISAGIQVARGYTWAQCVDQTVAVYQRVS